MIQIKVSPVLVKKVKKTFKADASNVFSLMKSLREQPNKGDLISEVSGVRLKEIKYDNVFRFYFFTNEKLVKFLDEDELQVILIKFVEMSKKNNQQKVIDKLKKDLEKFGFDWF